MRYQIWLEQSAVTHPCCVPWKRATCSGSPHDDNHLTSILTTTNHTSHSVQVMIMVSSLCKYASNLQAKWMVSVITEKQSPSFCCWANTLTIVSKERTILQVPKMMVIAKHHYMTYHRSSDLPIGHWRYAYKCSNMCPNSLWGICLQYILIPL